MFRLMHARDIEKVCDADRRNEPEIDEARRNTLVEGGYLFEDTEMNNLIIWK